MRLKTLGGLELEGSDLKRPQPLLLLTYLALEGTKDRQFLSEMFWRDARDPRNSLSSTLTRIRNTQADLVEADNKKVWTNLTTDAKELLEKLERNELKEAQTLYKGSFLAGYKDDELGEELSEWVYTYREYLAASFREALLSEANKEHQQEKPQEAATLAEQAYEIEGATALEPEDYQRIYSYLKLVKHPKAKTVLQDAEENELKLINPNQANDLKTPLPSKDIPNNLSASKTNFIGRDQELIDIAAYLGRPDCQLLTLHGMGGIGKTRLASQAAQDQLKQSHFTDGIYFIPLENVSSTNLLFPTIANAIKLELKADQDVYKQLTQHIDEKHILLVLDNFEHLVEAATEVSDLLLECPNLKLVVTSREILNIEEEWVKAIEGMRYPSAKQSLEESKYFEAVNLFVQRAKRTHSSFELTEDNLPHLIELCELTQGLPLALELAAAWVKMMSIEEISKEVKNNLKILESSKRNQAERHNGIEAVIKYSWNLLGKEEKDTMCNLSIFEGGFVREAAIEVTTSSLSVLLKLVNKSLVSRNGQRRFTLHPMIRHFVSLQLLPTSEKYAIVREKHFYYFLKLTSSVDYWGNKSPQHMEFIDVELANIKKSWFWASKTIEYANLLEAQQEIVTYFDRRVKLDEGIDFFETLASNARQYSSSTSLLIGKLLLNSGWLHFRKANFNLAQEIAQQSYALAKDNKDVSTLMKAQNIIGWTHYYEYCFTKALEYFNEAFAYAVQLKDWQRQAMYLSNIGAVHSEEGNFSKASDAYDRALKIYEKSESVFGQIPTMANIARLHRHKGEAHTSLQILSKALELVELVNYEYFKPFILIHKAETYYELKMDSDSLELAEELKQEYFSNRSTDFQVDLLILFCRLYLRSKELSLARQYFIDAYSLALNSNSQRRVRECLILIAESFLLMGELSNAKKVTIHLLAEKHLSPIDHKRLQILSSQFQRLSVHSTIVSTQELKEIVDGFVLKWRGEYEKT